MTNDYEASIHYNGIILLTAYLQRQFVYETVQVRLHNASDDKLKKVKDCLDRTHAMLKLFEETKSLLEGQTNKLKSFSEQVTLMMQNYIKEEPSFTERLAVVGSTLYAEQMMNNGIIRLGQVFQQNVGKDFTARTKFYEDRTKVIDIIVHLLADGKEVEEAMMQQIDKWYEGIAGQKNNILGDMKKINEMLDYTHRG
ncbi:transcriptional regulator [Solibacillus sp. R5-41]|uniref:transcriptional regulator n=1 Tax=Solibacillus sp. R5-41 TaxID=2048654 RepID=UPI000C1265BD|nr:transcriptional regulator [Solibacillus sp. R5-41]ATP40442.1 transcriptional regulator [Solibacillus sp. R5-41]